jgi:beta-glucosidase
VVVKEGSEAVVTFKVTNVGKVAGAEVAQVYVTDVESSLQRPAKELKGFDKVFLKPGESKTLSIRLGDKSFRFYDPYLHKFVLEDGEFTISVGASSADIRLTASVDMKF